MCSFFSSAGPEWQTESLTMTNLSEIPEISIEELEGRTTEGVLILDVREQHEYDEKRISGVVHIPLDELTKRLDELPAQTPMCVVCAKGGRSAKAVEYLLAQGFSAVNVEGGTDAWVESGRPHETGLS